jgi:hypothetical protein
VPRDAAYRHDVSSLFTITNGKIHPLKALRREPFVPALVAVCR